MSQEARFEQYETDSNYVGLYKLIKMTHGSAKSGWSVKDKIGSKRLLINTFQTSDE